MKLFKITFRSTSSKTSNINECRAWRKTWILACPLHKQPAALTFCLPGPLLAHRCEATRLPSRLIQVTYVTSLGYLYLQPASSEIFGYKYVDISPFFASISWPLNPGPFGCSQSIQNYSPKGEVNTVSSRTLGCR